MTEYLAIILSVALAALEPPAEGAVWNDVYTVKLDRPRTCSPLLNDPGEGLVLSAYSEARHGPLDVDWEAGTLVYMPEEGFTGFDFFIYTTWDAAVQAHRAAYVILDVRELAGDLNYDGSVGQADLDTVLTEWGETVGEGDTPEPGSFSFLAMGMVTLLWRRLRREGSRR